MKNKKQDFSEWYNEIVEDAKLIDKRYAIKGMNVWLQYGWKLMKNIDKYLVEIFEKHNHDEVNFPVLIPEDIFAKESEHIKGFNNEVFWVTHGGESLLDVKLLLRPTSETAMYPMFSLWIRSHTDLPLKIFQIVNTFRHETKQTRSFIRVREIHFFEAHTAHESLECAENQIKEDIIIWKKIADKLALPYLLLKRPDWDKFAGAEYSISADTILPTGKTLQIATIHQYKQNFSKPYDIKYLKENAEHEYVYQTTFGMSERLVGAIVSIHGDDMGLILPPEIAPIQAVIIPIVSKDKESVLKEATKLYGELENQVRIHLDERENYTPGYKFNDWEMKGVPLRIEIGPRDITNNEIVLVRRDTMEKISVKRQESLKHIQKILNEIQSNLKKSAENKTSVKIKIATDLKEITSHDGVCSIRWCGDENCGKEIEKITDKNVLGTSPEETEKGNCIICNKQTETITYIGKSL